MILFEMAVQRHYLQQEAYKWRFSLGVLIVGVRDFSNPSDGIMQID